MNLESLELTLSYPEGRECISDILSLCGVGPFAPIGDFSKDWYNIGRRSIGEELLFVIRQIEGTRQDGLSLEYVMLREKMQREKEER